MGTLRVDSGPRVSDDARMHAGWRIRRRQRWLSDSQASPQHPRVLLALLAHLCLSLQYILVGQVPWTSLVSPEPPAFLAGGLALSSEGFYLLGMVSQVNLHKHR